MAVDHFDRQDLLAILAKVQSTVGVISVFVSPVVATTPNNIDDQVLAFVKLSAAAAKKLASLDEETLDMVAGVVDSVLHALGHHSKDEMAAALRSSLSSQE